MSGSGTLQTRDATQQTEQSTRCAGAVYEQAMLVGVVIYKYGFSMRKLKGIRSY